MGKTVQRSVVILVGLGIYLVAMGLFLRFWAYDRVAVVPRDQNTAQQLVAQNAQFFDADKVEEGTGTITVDLRVIGDPTRSKDVSKEVGQNVVVLQKGQSADNNDTPPPIDYLGQTFAIARHGSQAVTWDDAMQDDEYTQFKGYLIKFPFNTQKKSYQYWDGPTKKTMTMAFKGVRTIKGTTGSIKTYYFEGSVPQQKYTTREVPRGIFGLPDTGGVNADRSYSVVRKLWVEPETGVFMKVEEQQKQLLTINEPGAKPVTALDADLIMTPATVQSNIDEYKTKSFLLKFVRVYGPLGLGLLGFGAVGLGVLLGRRGKNGEGKRVRADDQEFTSA